MSSRLSPAARNAKWHFALVAGVAALLMAMVLDCVFAATGASRYFFTNSTHVLPFEHSIAPTAPSNLGTGDVQLTLTWSGTNDLDLHCIGPDGERIYFAHRKSGSGGYLDLDMNASLPYSTQGTENIFWPTGGAPAGAYHVFVHHYRRHGGGDQVLYTLRVLNKGEVTLKQGWSTYQAPPSNPMVPELGDPDKVNSLPAQEVTAFTVKSDSPTPLLRLDYLASVGIVAAWLGLLAAAVAGAILGGLNRWYRANPELIFQLPSHEADTDELRLQGVTPYSALQNSTEAQPGAELSPVSPVASGTEATETSLSTPGEPPHFVAALPAPKVLETPQFPQGMFVEGLLTTPPVTRRIVLLSLLWGALIGGVTQIYFAVFATAALDAIELWRWLGWTLAALWLGGRLGRLVPVHLPLRDARQGGLWGGTSGGLLFSFLVVTFAARLGNSDLLFQGADSVGRLLAASLIGACIGYQVQLPYPPEPITEPPLPLVTGEAPPLAEPAPAPEPLPAPEPEPELPVAPEPEPEPAAPEPVQEPEPHPVAVAPIVSPPRPQFPVPEFPPIETPRVVRGPLGRSTSNRTTGLGRPNGVGRENSIGRRWTP